MRLTAVKLFLSLYAAVLCGTAVAETLRPIDMWPTADTLDALYESGNPDNLVPAGILASLKVGPTRYPVAEFFVAALEKDPSHILAAHSLLVHCSRTAAIQICEDDDYLRRAAGNDEDNGAMWAAYAARTRKHRGANAALPFLRRAAEASVYDGYFTSYMALFSDFLLREHKPALPHAHHMQLTMAFSGQAVNEVRMYGMCQSDKSPAWTEACLRLGRRIEDGSPMQFTATVGQKLQMSMLARGEDSQGVQAVKERHEKLKDLLDAPDPADYFGEEHEFWRELVETYISQGDLAAIRLTRERISESTPLDRWSEKEQKLGPVAQVGEGLAMANPIRAAASEFIVTENRAPASRKEAGLSTDPRDTSSRFVDSIDIVSGAVVVKYGNDADPRLQGLTLVIRPYMTEEMSLVWQCGYSPAPLGLTAMGGSSRALATTVPPDFVPAVCLP